DAVAQRLPVHGLCQVAERLVLGDGQVAALEADGAQAQLAERLGDGVVERLGGRADERLQAGALGGGLLGEAGVADEPGAVARRGGGGGGGATGGGGCFRGGGGSGR